MNLLNDTLLKAQGLNARRIRTHQKRILQALHNEINTDISVQDACTIANGGIISFGIAQQILAPHFLATQSWSKNHVVSCIPAAGAASRFFLELKNFVAIISNEMKKTDKIEFTMEFLTLISEFTFISQLNEHMNKQKDNEYKIKEEKLFQEVFPCFVIKNEEENLIVKAYCISQLLIESYSHKPKLAVPATLEGDCFLKLKIEEQLDLFPCLGNTLVVPNTSKKEIQNLIYQINSKEYDKWFVLEQDHKLSTIRFKRTGEPFLNEEKKLSLVCAGHGELLHLFDNIADNFPASHCLHIRNIDNIIGTNDQQKIEFNIPSQLFYHIRELLELLRKKIPILHIKSATEIQDSSLNEKFIFISKLIFNEEEQQNLQNKTSLSSHYIYNILVKLFHWQSIPKNISNMECWKMILENCEKPLSVFAVVKKEKGDVGGGPVFAQLSDGSKAKFCMEMPHATPKDADEYFSHTGKTTHFNPALVFFEFRTHTYSGKNLGKKVNFVQLFDDRFWILAKREYNGEPVCYHETVLYELIGNSATTNLVFIEVPRSLFKPHKSYLDCLEQDRNSYGFKQNIKPK